MKIILLVAGGLVLLVLLIQPERNYLPSRGLDKVRAAPSPGGDNINVNLKVNLNLNGKLETSFQQWSEILKKVSDLSPTNQKSLEKLYSEARDLVQKSEGNSQALSEFLGKLSERSLEQSVFTITTLIRYSKKPLAVLDSILSQEGVGPKVQTELQEHHLPPSDWEKIERLQAFSMEQVRERIAKGWIPDAGEKTEMVPRLVSLVSHEKSLNLTIEGFHLLIALGERGIVQGLLSHRSARDQEILSEILSL